VPRLPYRWLPALALMAAIYWFSAQPAVRVGAAMRPLNEAYPAPAIRVAGDGSRSVTLEWTKVGHAVGYFGLGAALLFALRREPRFRRGWPRQDGTVRQPGNWTAAGAAVLLAAAYAASDELHQTAVPGRSAALLDVVLDSAAALAGVAACLALGVTAARQAPRR